MHSDGMKISLVMSLKIGSQSFDLVFNEAMLMAKFNFPTSNTYIDGVSYLFF